MRPTALSTDDFSVCGARETSLAPLLVRLLVLSVFLSFACPPSRADQGGQRLSCRNFHRNADGSWSIKRAVELGSVTMGAGVSFGERVVVEGVDLAATLDRQCR
jgi:hypothetical protein